MESSGAEFSDCGRYRYKLWRQWDAARSSVMFVMLNPSTADEERDDPTIRRCVNYAKSWGFGGLTVGNLFAWRTPYPGKLRTAADPIGPGNDRALLDLAGQADRIVAAWGNDGSLFNRSQAVRRLLPDGIRVLRLNKGGEPTHPGRLSRKLKPRKWR